MVSPHQNRFGQCIMCMARSGITSMPVTRRAICLVQRSKPLWLETDDQFGTAPARNLVPHFWLAFRWSGYQKAVSTGNMQPGFAIGI